MSIHQKLRSIDLLLAGSHESRFSDPARMVYLAELAEAAANRLSPDELPSEAIADVRARVWAELGNAYRLADALDRSHRAFELALDCYERGTGDSELLALIVDRFASLLSHLRREPEAFPLLDRLASLYESRGDRHLAGRTLILRGALAANSGDPSACIAYTSKGLTWVSPAREPALIPVATHNLLNGATALGHFSLVAHLIPKVRHLYEGSPLLLLRLRWLEGRVAEGMDELAAAEEAYREARDGFSAAGLEFPACLVALDWVLMLSKQRRWREILPLAEEMLVGFRSLRVSREALLTLVLLRRACETGAAEAAQVADSIAKLRDLLLERAES